MTEQVPPGPKREGEPNVREVRYPGFTTTLREITTQPRDVDAISAIERGLSSAEFDEIAEDTSSEGIESWLRKDVTRNFKYIVPGSKHEAVVGVEEGKDAASGAMIIATTPFGQAEGLAAYTYIYHPETISKDVLESRGAKSNVQVSFVTATADKDRDVDQIAESFMQTAMFLWEKSVGKKTAELNGILTSEQIAQAKESLAIFEDTGTEENETKYREGLLKAGYQQIATFIKDGKERLVFQLPIDFLVAAFEQKKNTV